VTSLPALFCGEEMVGEDAGLAFRKPERPQAVDGGPVGHPFA
jgi:hypothetical protein